MTKLRKDSRGNFLCVHCGHALDAQMRCRQCKGHVAKPADAAFRVNMQEHRAHCDRLASDIACQGCGHFVCSCPKFDPIAYMQKLADEIFPARLSPRVRYCETSSALNGLCSITADCSRPYLSIAAYEDAMGQPITWAVARELGLGSDISPYATDAQLHEDYDRRTFKGRFAL